MAIYSLRIEKHVLGGLIKNPGAFPEVERFINENDFYSEVHNTIFCVVRETLLKKERIDNSVLSVASKMNAINPQQVVDLLKTEIKLNDDNRIEILDNNTNIRYNEKGEPLTIEQRVKEFLDANPHFSQGSKSGTGSQSSIEGKTVKPFKISDLDMSKQEDRAKYAEYRTERDSKPTQINLNK